MPAFFLILACVLWAVSFPLVKALHLEQSARLPDASSIFLASWMQVARFGLGAVVLLPFALARGWPTAGEVRQGIVLAVWGGVGMAVQADALAYTEASTSAFLTQAYCIFLPLWACIRTRRLPAGRVISATAMVLAGGAILSGLRHDHLHLGRGEIGTLIAAFLFTFQILALENPRHARNRGLQVTLVMFAAIAVILMPVTLLAAPRASAVIAAGASWPAGIIIAALSAFSSVGAHLLMNCWQPRVGATEAGLIYTVEPVFTGIYVLFLPVLLGQLVGASYPNERLTPQLLLGGGLIVVANLLMQWKRPPHLPPAGPVS